MIPGYFIAPDGAGDIWVWAGNGDFPLPIVGSRTFLPHALPLWRALAAQLEVRDR